jgi:hypothetical protein
MAHRQQSLPSVNLSTRLFLLRLKLLQFLLKLTPNPPHPVVLSLMAFDIPCKRVKPFGLSLGFMESMLQLSPPQTIFLWIPFYELGKR